MHHPKSNKWPIASFTFCMLLLWAVVSTGVAQAAGRVALVIGNGSYSEDIGELNNTINDAVAIRKLLKQLDFDVQMELDLDREAMVEVISDFATGKKGADAALIFYAGHGAEINGKNILFPVDLSLPLSLTEEELLEAKPLGSKRAQKALLRKKRLSALEAGTVSLERLSSAASSRSERAIIIVDACRDDAFNRMVDIKNVTSALRRQGRAKGALYAFAASPGEPALDGEGENSPFTSALLKYLGTPGQDITIAMKLVQQEVYDKTSGLQLPYIVSGLPSSFIPNRSVSALDEREQLLLAMAELTLEDKRLVERVARRNQNMPLAPLYASLLTRGSTTFEEKGRELELAAKKYADFQEAITGLNSDDPKVQALRAEAQELMRLGAEKTANERLTKAIEIDRQARQELGDRFGSRMLSEADTLTVRAQNWLIQYERAEALVDMRRALELYRKVMIIDEEAKDEVKLKYGDLLISVVDELISSGATEEALNFARSAKRFYKESTEDSPSNTGFREGFATVFNRIGDIYELQGNLNRALEMLEQARAISESLVDLDPTNVNFQEGLAGTLSRIGDIYELQGNLNRALEMLEQARAISESLVDLDPTNVNFQEGLAATLSRLGKVYELQGNLNRALEVFEQDRTISESLVDLDPTNVNFKAGLAGTLSRIGDIYELQGNLNRALEVFEQDRTISESLVDLDPTNVNFKAGLAITLYRLGRIYYLQGDLDKALEMNMAGLSRFSELLSKEQSNVDWQRRFLVINTQLATVLRLQGNYEKSAYLLGSALGFAMSNDTKIRNNKIWSQTLTDACDELSEFSDLFKGYEYDEYTNASDFCRNWISN